DPGRRLPPKVAHAEPLFIDLIRDLGARRGEAEWNLGMGLTDRTSHDEYRLLVEYEWAPVDRVGVELELPVSLHSALEGTPQVPRDRLDGLKAAVQWTFLVSEPWQTSAAVGYLTEWRSPMPAAWLGDNPRGVLANPFAVVAHRWPAGWHSLVLAGARFDRVPGRWKAPVSEFNLSQHYLLPSTRNFVGLEANALVSRGRWDVVLRPQMRLAIFEHFLVGIAVSVPATTQRDRERLGTFFRFIYEPGHRK
nr:hypothetical protein [Gemmatimonadaceae bacterium]